MSTITSSQLDFIPRQEDSDQLFDAGNIVLYVVDIDNIDLSIEKCFDLIKHGVERTKLLHLNNTMKDLRNKSLKHVYE